MAAVSPRLSVVIPAFRAEHHLAACLRGFAAQSVDGFEVVVVDDCSPDGTAAVAEGFGVRVVRQATNGGAAAARNAGAAAADGAVLLFVDSDVVPEPGLVAATLAVFDAGATVATGCYGPEPANPAPLARYKALWTWHCWQQSAGQTGESGHIQGALAAVRADVFEAVGGFDESYVGGSVEDYEWSIRAREAGHAIAFDAAISGRHHFPEELRVVARNYWDRARMWSRLRGQDRSFSSGQASARNGVAAVLALGSAVGHLAGPLGLPLALASDAGWLLCAAPFLRFVAKREGVPFALYAAGVHWSLSAVVGAAAATAPFGSGSRRTR